VTTVATASKALITCRGLTVSYESGAAKVVALADVDLGIRPRESVALWGPSGSGKTTLLHALGGLVTPSAGTVSLRGELLSSLDAAARARIRARGIAYVFQSPNLLPSFTAFENVAFAIHASGTADQGAEPERLLTLVGLGSKLDSLPPDLSGGEAQRVAIARALGQRPQLLLCDEPTGHLDSDTGERVLNLIDALQEEFGFALVVATHDADVAARYDRTIALHDGRVVGEETYR
jgi:predicted ABC-type transport system involved in lysophospholipase L1 biosynthesis ATPase subunit